MTTEHFKILVEIVEERDYSEHIRRTNEVREDAEKDTVRKIVDLAQSLTPLAIGQDFRRRMVLVAAIALEGIARHDRLNTSEE